MPCSRKEALAKFFFNNAIKFFFLFFYLFSLFLAKLFTFFFRYEDEYDDDESYEDEEEDNEEEEEEENVEEEYRYQHVEGAHLVADIVNDGGTLVFHPNNELHGVNNNEHVVNNISLAHSNSYESLFEDPVEFFDDEVEVHSETSTTCSETEHEYSTDYVIEQVVDYEAIKQDHTSRFEPNLGKTSEFIEHNNTNGNIHHEIDQQCEPTMVHDMPTKSPSFIEAKAYGTEINAAINYSHDVVREIDVKKMEVVKESANFTKDDKFLIFDPPKSEVKKLLQELEREEEGNFEDTYTVGSTSKSSSDWRSSMRDSAITDDPFSSSSRRSCPKWESYAVYQKYDEEMMFLDRISAQKLHETESLRSFQVEPRSISQRIVHKIANNKKRRNPEDEIYKKNNNPYNELEVAYVAQICLAWEALNWNYATFQRKQSSKTELDDNGCPAYIAQQFQQFQVLLQRYIENEPYERGKRPEIYARMRSVSPKLLQVPEYHDYEGEENEDGAGRIASELFLRIIEDAIQTFMNFLKADRETHCQIIKAALFKPRQKGTIDPNVIKVVKKYNKKKKLKVKDLQRTRVCLRKRKLPREEEMEILMGLIDLKVVSRVLRMADLTPEQLHWCEAKMGKLRILEGKLLRDSSPLFFPAH